MGRAKNQHAAVSVAGFDAVMGGARGRDEQTDIEVIAALRTQPDVREWLLENGTLTELQRSALLAQANELVQTTTNSASSWVNTLAPLTPQGSAVAQQLDSRLSLDLQETQADEATFVALSRGASWLPRTLATYGLIFTPAPTELGYITMHDLPFLPGAPGERQRVFITGLFATKKVIPTEFMDLVQRGHTAAPDTVASFMRDWVLQQLADDDNGDAAATKMAWQTVVRTAKDHKETDTVLCDALQQKQQPWRGVRPAVLDSLIDRAEDQKVRDLAATTLAAMYTTFSPADEDESLRTFAQDDDMYNAEVYLRRSLFGVVDGDAFNGRSLSPQPAQQLREALVQAEATAYVKLAHKVLWHAQQADPDDQVALQQRRVAGDRIKAAVLPTLMQAIASGPDADLRSWRQDQTTVARLLAAELAPLGPDAVLTSLQSPAHIKPQEAQRLAADFGQDKWEVLLRDILQTHASDEVIVERKLDDGLVDPSGFGLQKLTERFRAVAGMSNLS